jgi:hypothetical protein
MGEKNGEQRAIPFHMETDKGMVMGQAYGVA